MSFQVPPRNSDHAHQNERSLFLSLSPRLSHHLNLHHICKPDALPLLSQSEYK